MDTNQTDEVARLHFIYYHSSVALTVLSVVALAVNLYLLNCSRFLRRPIGVNLRLCVSLTASDALAAFCYILTYTINVIFPSEISNCWSLLLEVIKLATFFASVSTLLILALNHYVGIVYPLQRHVITNRSVRITIFLSYLLPFAVFLTLFCVVPGGLSAPIAFGFFNKNGCNSARILQNPIIRSAIVAPFIVFTLAISFLYSHIIYHMSRTSKDPLLTVQSNKTKRNYNAKLLGTLALLAGSAVIGWLPTTVLFAVICAECIFPIGGSVVLYLTIFSHLLNILKLIFDAFIYASRLVEIRYAMWEFHNQMLGSVDGIFGSKRHSRDVPPEFAKYLNDTKHSVRNRRMTENSRFAKVKEQKKRSISAVVHESKERRSKSLGEHRSLGLTQSIPMPTRSVQFFEESLLTTVVEI